jgi:hypothetical protein
MGSNGPLLKFRILNFQEAPHFRQKTMGKWWCIYEQLDGSDGTGND